MFRALKDNHPLRQSLATGLLTALILALLVAGVRSARVATAVTPRTEDGGYGEPIRRTLPVVEVWGLLLDRLPAEVPGLLGREVLLLLLPVAAVAAAYLLAATLRLPGAR